MRSANSRTEYEARMHRVQAYIDAHLDQSLDLASLAQVAHFSPYQERATPRELIEICAKVFNGSENELERAAIFWQFEDQFLPGDAGERANGG
jgi:hypothetical protein